MLNVIKAIKNLKSFTIQEINSVREIDNYLRWSNTSSFKKAFTLNNKNMLNTMIKNNISYDRKKIADLKKQQCNSQSNSNLNSNININSNAGNVGNGGNNTISETELSKSKTNPNIMNTYFSSSLTKSNNNINSNKNINNSNTNNNANNNNNYELNNIYIKEFNIIDEESPEFHEEGLYELSNLNIEEDKLDINDVNQPSYESMYNFKAKQNTLDNMINEYAKMSECEQLVSQGEESQIARFKKLIISDTKRNIFAKSERDKYFVNQTSPEGMTLLYHACLNGHINYVECLLDCDADHLIKCGKKNEDKLSILDAAVRWSHIKLVSYLINDNKFKINWPVEYISSALKIAEKIGNKYIISLLKNKKRSFSKGCCVACT